MKDETFLAENGFSVVCTFDFLILPLLDVVSSPLFFYRTTSKKFGHPLNIFCICWPKILRTEDSSTGSALSVRKFYFCNAGNARSDAIPKGLVTRDPLRLYPVLFAIPRRPKQDIILGGYHISGGTAQVEFLLHQMG